jgi:16S rRNA (uracil1498-N3)-methyltransferase
MTTHQFFIQQSQIENGTTVTIEGSDARHIRLVLRLKKGDRIRLVDEEQSLHEASVESVTGKAVVARIVETERGAAPSKRLLTVVQSIPRLPKADLIVQKLTELGAVKIIFSPTERSPYRDGQKRMQDRLERLRRIAGEAAKQCSRSSIPDVAVCADLKAALEALGPEALMLVANENAGGKSLRDCFGQTTGASDVAIFIGPEGGFTPEETRLLESVGADSFSIGRNILRTETAAIVAAALVLYEMGEM